MLILGCRADPPAPSLRFIEDDPQRSFQPDLVYSFEAILDWELPGATKSEGPDPNLPLLDREVGFEATEVQRIEVMVEAMPLGTLALRWRTPEHEFSKDRQIQLQAEHQNPGEVKRFAFEVNTHPLWEGRITGLRLYTARSIRETVAPIRCRVLKRSLDPLEFEAASSGAWKINLNRDIRNALLSPPGGEIVRQMTIPQRARLHFAYGIDAGIRRPVEFRVLARQGAGNETLLFSDTIEGAVDPAAGWREASVELDAVTGRSVELVLQALSDFDPAQGLPYWANPEVVNLAENARPPNVILISIDTLRAENLSAYGYQRDTSPHLDRWAAKNAVVFENAISQAPSTLPSHTSIFTGLDAFRHGANHDPGPTSLVTLAELLREAGYRTLAQTGGGYMHPVYGFDQGFDVYRYWLWGYERLEEFRHGLDSTLGWLEAHRERPFFLFFHTYEVHGPYRARQPFFERLTGRAQAARQLLWITTRRATAEEGFRKNRGPIYRYGSPDPALSTTREGSAADAIDRYDSSIAYVDEGLAEIWRLLDSPPFAHNTLVVVTSDHGEAFGEHDLAGHGYLYDDNLKVPLIVALPAGRFAGRRVARQVRTIDILPTLLEALDLGPLDGIDGRSLIPLLETPGAPFPREAWSYAANDNFGTALRVDNRVKYLFNDAVWPPVHGSEELYDLTTDPGENLDLAATSVQTESLRERVREELASGTRGLVVELRNDGTETLRGELTGDWVGPTRVKTSHLPCSCVRWKDDGGVAFEVPPGIEYTLILDANPNNTGVIRLASVEPPKVDETGALVHHLRLDELREPLSITFATDEWQTAPVGSFSGATTGLILRWQGRSAEEGVDLGDAEADLRRQMKALGYLQ